MPTIVPVFVACLTLLSIGAEANPARSADKRLKGIACRSVHLSYRDAPDGVAFYNQVQVRQSAPGTYFCVCGFSRGYFGIQQLADDRRLLIFSVWDPGNQNDPNAVADEQRVRLVHQHPDVRVGRFGNEGTGGQSFFDYPWSNGVPLRFVIGCHREENRTHYAAFFFHPDRQEWVHLATFSTLTSDERLKGYYAFVEDFRRNRISATQTRTADFGQGFVLQPDGVWSPLSKAQFTADSNPVLNINAGVSNAQFYLSTGGDIVNDDVPLRGMIELPNRKPGAPDLSDSVVETWLRSTAAVTVR